MSLCFQTQAFDTSAQTSTNDEGNTSERGGRKDRTKRAVHSSDKLDSISEKTVKLVSVNVVYTEDLDVPKFLTCSLESF